MSIDQVRAYFGFTKMPFGKALAPSALYKSQGHQEAVARIAFLVGEAAIGVVTGEVGSGKTVAARAALAELEPSRHSIVYLPNPAVGARGLYTELVSRLGAEPRFHKAALIAQATSLLAAECSERGRRPVVVCDEAHLLDSSQLEELRLLTSSEMDSANQFALILIGQPLLRARLRLGSFAALEQRLALRYVVPPMSPEETAGYVSHHVKWALLTELPGKHHLVSWLLCGRVPSHGQRGEPCTGLGVVRAPTSWGSEGDRRPLGAGPAVRP